LFFSNHKFLYLKSFNASKFFLMVIYFSIFILTLLGHTFWVHIFHPICMINSKLSFQRSIMTLLLKKTNHQCILIWFTLKSIATWIMLMLNMALHLKFIYNPKKLQLWQSKHHAYPLPPPPPPPNYVFVFLLGFLPNNFSSF
jgi:hypothetical protein